MKLSFADSDRELADILISRAPLLDVRAPVEFNAGNVPNAVNLPLLIDSERERIGTTYKTSGSDAAIALGHELVSGTSREVRIRGWVDFARTNPRGRLYCFRGGLRSQLVQDALKKSGAPLPLIAGGYKRFRQFFIDTIERVSQHEKFVIISGLTGSGKTALLHDAKNFRVVDLELAAHHRGSAFGRLPLGQPSQVNFENALAVDLLHATKADTPTPILIEDESRMIGKSAIPLSLFTVMQNAPIYVIERSVADRATDLISHYLIENYSFKNGLADGAKAEQLGRDLELQFQLIQRRLGGAETNLMLELMRGAQAKFSTDGNFSHHQEWVERLLQKYYDPMYAHHIEKQKHRIVFRGVGADALQAIAAAKLN